MYYPNVLGRQLVAQNSPAARLYFKLDKLAIKVANKYISLTDAMTEEFADAFDLPMENAVTIYCGVDEDRFASREGGNNDSNVDVNILYWGNYINFHGVSELLSAAESHPDKEFVFLGDGGSRTEIMEDAKRKSLDNVKFEGFVDNKTLLAYIDAADLVSNRLVHNPHGDIGIGNKAAEAAYFSKPMLSVDSPAICELFEDGETAVLLEDRTMVSDRIGQFYEMEKEGSIGDQAGEVYDEFMEPEIAADRFLGNADD
ncbi:glycosyltransferase family 4 protein [Halobacterium litoreum]|uniref:Glycosyltransferase family 4 protein n=1 Tax=Halobacterium litoreum TaxID=2039234 RepID=A0ABD5NAQ6_9EURY|nr:glycosyltransferase [Halobacterium litoreum]UHH14730.1 glycosyltransferase [Halobacterium litoreum]